MDQIVNHFKHEHCNAQLHAAPGDEDHVDTLWVQHGIIEDMEMRVTRSFWRPTTEELAAMAAGAPVLLTVRGSTHPPLRLDVLKD